MKSNKGNNYAFIDSQNVNLAIRSLGWKINWLRFRIYLKEHYGISKAFLFIGYVPGNEHLYTKLQSAGFVCIFKPTLTYQDGSIKGNVDAELVLHTILEINNYDQALVISGDGDFHCLIKYLVEHEKLLLLLVPNKYKYSSLLKRFARKHIQFMNQLKNKIGVK